MRIRTGVYWSAVARHGTNQDSLSLQHVAVRNGECLLAVVCDGIGSLACSQEASGCAVHCMTDWFYQEGKKLIIQNSSKETILFALQEQFCHIQATLRKLQTFRHLQTGTTLSAILIIKDRYYLIHIGDSRIYQFRKKKIPLQRQPYHTICLTKDDRNRAGYLLKCAGMAGEDRAVIETGRVRPGTGFLLCSDGFYHGNPKEQIGRVLGPLLLSDKKERQRAMKRKDRGDALCDRRLELLGEQAFRAGSRDNMAAVGIFICQGNAD